MKRPRPSQPTAILYRYAQRFEELKGQLQQVEYFCKGTVLTRMMKCGKAHCACSHDPAKRHGPYFEWTYKAKGKPSMSNSRLKQLPFIGQPPNSIEN